LPCSTRICEAQNENIFTFAMRTQYLHNNSDYRSIGGGGVRASRDSGGLFWWTIFIFLLLALATLSWFFSIMVFTYPEKPMNYRLLTKLEKLEPLKKWALDKVPLGKYLGPAKLLEEYSFFTPDRLRVVNDTLKREYIRNFKENNPVYISGKFLVFDSRKLTADDVFTEGWVVAARSEEMEDVTVEMVLPGLTIDQAPFPKGTIISLDKNKHFANAVHVQKHDDDKLRVTMVPLLYDSITTTDGKVATLAAPTRLNMDGGWPIMRDTPADPATETVEAPKSTEVTVAQPSTDPAQ
jgi:hypothetical protein